MIQGRANDIRRLNVILKLPAIDVEALNEDKWNAFLDDLYFAVFGEKDRVVKENVFHSALTKKGVRAAQEGLRAQLPVLQRHRGEDLAPRFELSKQSLYIAYGRDGFVSKFSSTDCPTMIYTMLAYLLEKSKITQSDILTCANYRCEAHFVPLRKPHEGKRSFCSSQCANLVSAGDYRERNKDKLQPKERGRSQERHENRIRELHPKAKIRKRVRKSK